MVPPTVGRNVWFYPHGSDLNATPLAAIVTAVWTDTRVNLAVFDRDGVPLPSPPTNVLFVHEAKQRPESGRCYCTWPTRVEEPGKALSEIESQVGKPMKPVRKRTRKAKSTPASTPATAASIESAPKPDATPDTAPVDDIPPETDASPVPMTAGPDPVIEGAVPPAA